MTSFLVVYRLACWVKFSAGDVLIFIIIIIIIFFFVLPENRFWHIIWYLYEMSNPGFLEQ